MSSSNTVLFVIVGRNEPLYEAELRKGGGGSSANANNNNQSSDSITRQNYFVLHSALDLVEKVAFTTSQMYLKVVDKVNQQQVSTFLTAGNIKFMLVHSSTGTNGRIITDESITNFFQDVYELYVKVSKEEKKDRKSIKIYIVLSCFYYNPLMVNVFMFLFYSSQ